MADFAKEVFMEKIDSQWEDFGNPKLRKDLGLPEREVETEDDIMEKTFSELKRENTWVEVNTFTLKNRSDSRFSHHGKENRKKRNKKLAKAKGYNLDACARPDRNGSRSVLSDRYSNRGHCKKWYSDSVKGMEQNKVSARELKNYFDSLVKDEAREKDFQEKYYEDINDISLEELVNEYLRLRAEGYIVRHDYFRDCNRNQLLNSMTVTDDCYPSEDDYYNEYTTLYNVVHFMKKKKEAVQPLFEVADILLEEYGYKVTVATEKIPAGFLLSEMKDGIFVREEYNSFNHEELYVFYAEKKEDGTVLPLFKVDKNLTLSHNLSSLLRELDMEFLIKLDEYR